MTRKQKEIAELKRQFIINRSSGICEHKDCENPGNQVAHKISKSKSNIKKYGHDIVHHPKLLRWTCPEHNDSFNIGFKPAVIKIEIEKIKKAGIENWGEDVN